MDSINAPDDVEEIQRDVMRRFERARQMLNGRSGASAEDDQNEADASAVGGGSSVAHHYGFGGALGDASRGSKKRGRSASGRGEFDGDLDVSDRDDDDDESARLQRASFQARNHQQKPRPKKKKAKKAKKPSAKKRRRGGDDDSEDIGSQDTDEDEEEEPQPPVVKREFLRTCAPDRALLRRELGHPDPPNHCFGCLHGRDDSVSFTFEAYKRMEAMFASKMSITEAIDLARLCAEFYEEEIRKPANDPEVPREEGEQPLPAWNAATIYAHFTAHIVDFSIRRLNRIQMLQQVADSIYENGGLFNTEVERTYDVETGELLAQKVIGPLINPQQWKIFKDVLITEARLYGQNPRTAMFSWTGVGTTQDESLSLINMSKRRAHSRNVARLTGVSLANRGSSAGVGSTVQGTSRATS